MKINIDTPIKNLDGKPLDEGATFRKLALQACVMPVRGDDTATGEQRLSVYRLSQKLNAGDQEIDLTIEEAKILKDRLLLTYPSPLVYGRMCEVLGD